MERTMQAEPTGRDHKSGKSRRARIAAATAAFIMLNAEVSAAETPTYGISGLPLTPHQVSVIGSGSIQEMAPSPGLTVNGMPASPHQLRVLRGGE
jgi:hypothetical protein